MAELTAAGIGIADVCIRLIHYLKDVKAAAEAIDDDIGGLTDELGVLMAVHGQLEQEYNRSATKKEISQHQKILWLETAQTLKNSQKLVQKLEHSVRKIYGDNRSVSGKRDAYLKQHRKRGQDSVISGFRNQISTCHGALKIWLQCIEMYSARERHEDNKAQLDTLSTLVKGLESRLEQMHDPLLPPYERSVASTYLDFNSSSLSVLHQIELSINNIGQNITRVDTVTNKHFDTPKPVDPFYTGREVKAEMLKKWLIPESGEVPGKLQSEQKRFVIYGVGGAGKTQFCCKFAEDNRESFWGVFWVDGSSQQRLEQTFAQNVSPIGGVAENSRAALQWLANRNEPWLLIIDNADDPDLELQNYFPIGNRGHILITTRDPHSKVYGTVGKRFFEFQGLETNEASQLLLKASGFEMPWDSVISNIAKTIANALGYLAIAIKQAGISIRLGACKLHEYLEYWERQWKKKRQSRLPVKSKDGFDDLKVFATFELNRITLEKRDVESCRDALQLLNTFAFLHNQNIRFDFLRRSIVNAELEKNQAEEDKRNQTELQKRVSGAHYSWSAWWRDTKFAIMAYIFKNHSPAVLPSVIRDARRTKEFDPDRLRRALRQLTKFSLVIHNEKTDAYSVHPLVHKWARERPDMSTLEQAVWAEAAAVLLSSCVLLPPLGTTTEEEQIRQYLLPHVEFVSKCQQSIEQRMRDKRMGRMKPWPVFEGGFNREKALMYAKFSMVYAQNGRWEEAKRLQMTVREVTLQFLGLEHAATRRITFALSGTLYLLGETDHATQLRRDNHDACVTHMGDQHPETLNAKCSLGQLLHTQGRHSESKELLEAAVEGLIKIHGKHHTDTLDAIDYLGRTLFMFYTPESLQRARELHLQAIEGMKEVHGRHHLRTLEACENLCRTAVEIRNQEHLEAADAMMQEVWDVRKNKLGKEHGLTLLAMVNLSCVKSEMDELDEAEALIEAALEIGERDLGRDHQACLWARYLLGKIWAKQEQWSRVESHLEDVVLRQMKMLQGRGRYHPDRLGALTELATAYHALGKAEERDSAASEALEGFAKINGSKHPVALRLREKAEKWKEEKVDNASVHDDTHQLM